MKLAFSNLAWNKDQDAQVRPLLKQGGVQGIEIAPGKIWRDPSKVPATEARAYAEDWAQEGLPIIALQSLLFGHPELVLFQQPSARSALLGYLSRLFDLAQTLGASCLVFGSPKNRLKGDMPQAQAEAIAVDFFRKAGAAAHDRGVVLCLEANAIEYGCDFVTTTDQAAAIVAAVGSPGFGLHLDWGCMDLARENALQQVRSFAAQTKHFHLSSFQLRPITDRDKSTVDTLVQEFTRAGSEAWASVEMLNPKGELETIRAVLREIGPCFEGR